MMDRREGGEEGEGEVGGGVGETAALWRGARLEDELWAVGVSSRLQGALAAVEDERTHPGLSEWR